ncbi:MAG: SDR family NAD(P)-dependent oxidoreductase [Thermodesulfobacteriota bacterium]
MKLKDKVAIVTGGGTGIGEATAILFAKEGANVIVTGRRKEMLQKVQEDAEKQNLKIDYVVCDVSKEENCKSTVDHAIDKYGHVDILFNNAGVLPLGLTHETSVEDWDNVFDINVKGTFLMSKNVIPHMIKQGHGTIVNNASVLGLKAIPGTAAYNASKGAITQLTRSMALEYGESGIRVNCICPGTIMTPMVESFLEERPEVKGFLESKQPITKSRGNFGIPDEIAHAVLFLSDSENVHFMTGTMLSVDGGWIAS